MKDAYIISAVRTAVGKAPRGTLRHTRPDDMAAAVLKAVIDRVPGVEPSMIEDAAIGCAMPEAEQGLNVARMAWLRAGLPVETPALTINRFCASGLETINYAASKVRLGDADLVIAGGTESMSLIPMGGHRTVPNLEVVESQPEHYITMGLTAERVAAKYDVRREEQDEFALSSHMKAIDAIDNGRFKDEIVPLTVRTPVLDDKGKVRTEETVFDTDEGPRRDTTLERLAKLKPVFMVDGTVTAGNTSQMSDGASATIVASEEMVKKLGVTPLARWVGYAAAGVEPDIMGIGPIEAIPKALARTGLKLEDIGLIELNEAFAAQSLAVVKTLGLPLERLNVNGGAIALGHPLGCTGNKLTCTLLYEMKRRKTKYGMVTMCVGGGMGAAGIFELVS
ncbi:MAG: acetyl-CoA C-acyltransferase [bacterium]